jgi:hypothetical protein
MRDEIILEILKTTNRLGRIIPVAINAWNWGSTYRMALKALLKRSELEPRAAMVLAGEIADVVKAKGAEIQAEAEALISEES